MIIRHACVVLIVFLVFSCLVVPVESNDDVIGQFELVDTLDPIILGWYQTNYLIQSYNRVVFNLTVFDVNNDSSQLQVKMFYSEDSFAFSNESVPMLYQKTITADTYYYEFDSFGFEDGTYLQYYYFVYDGQGVDRKPSREYDYYSIQWSDLGVTIIRDPSWMEHSKPVEPVPVDDAVMFVLVGVMFFIVFFMVFKGKKRVVKKSRV